MNSKPQKKKTSIETGAPKKKPDIEYGIHNDGSLRIWCNCPDKTKPRKGQVICDDCAEYFTDKLEKALMLVGIIPQGM